MNKTFNKDEYYLCDSRTYVGNSMLFWRKENNGYTTNPDEARVFTEKEAFGQHRERETDIPYYKPFIDNISKKHVDIQDIQKYNNQNCICDPAHIRVDGHLSDCKFV